MATIDLVAEWSRLGVDGTGDWRLDEDANADFGLCTTYPRALAVPKQATTAQMAAVLDAE